MRSILAFTPPDLQEAREGVVRRRLVFFVAGYDPEARVRYRMLFVRELLLAARRFGLPARKVSRLSRSEDGLAQSWDVAACPETGGAAVTYETLHWEDIVARDGRRPPGLDVVLIVAGTLHALVSGLIWRFYRMNPLYGNVIVYPFAMVLALGLAATLVTVLADLALGALGLPRWAALPLALGAGLGWIPLLRARLDRMFFWLLLRSWVFHWQHGNGWRKDYEARVEAFTAHVAARIAAVSAAEPPDEILIVGHSTGGLTAAEITVRLLERMPGLGAAGPALSLATLGSALPLVATRRAAWRVRAEVARLVSERRLVWCDFQAPQDWMNFPGFNPSRDLDLPLEGRPVANPIVRSAQFKQLLAPETYAKVRNRPFRMHFQFLMANERAGEYDFFRMVLGPQYLRERAMRPSLGPDPVGPVPARE